MLADIWWIPVLTMLIYMSIWYFIALVQRRNDLADVAWGLGFIVIAWVTALSVRPFTATSALILGLVTAWGLRLSLHIWQRHRRTPEDERYAIWRRQWNWFKLRSFLQIFLLQGVLMLGVSLPVLLIVTQPMELGWLSLLGVMIWTLGFELESVADRQLRNFVLQPKNKGKLMDQGLWKYSRHPNYFGEITQWWGIGIIALGVPYGWIGLFGPLLITYLIVKVSGIPMLEKKLSQNPAYLSYQQRTSALVPWPNQLHKKYLTWLLIIIGIVMTIGIIFGRDLLPEIPSATVRDEAVHDNAWANFVKPSAEELKQLLTPLQYEVTQEEGTETPYANAYHDNKADGIYVDVVSGEPLFSSTHKYDSGTGWPSFFQPISEAAVITSTDYKLIFPRTELRSRYADSHLGHLFEDGPAELGGKRYCINSAALRFVPKEEMTAQGYEKYLMLFQ